MPESVECHSGYTYGERPVAFQWEGERLIVAEIEARWRLPRGPAFRVRTQDDRVFELFYNEPQGEWVIRVP